MPGQILAMGGGGFMRDARSPLDDFLLSLSSSSHPRICLLPTSSGDGDRLVDGGFTPGYAEDGVALEVADGKVADSDELDVLAPSLSSFGVDGVGRVYVTSTDGSVYRLDPRPTG